MTTQETGPATDAEPVHRLSTVTDHLNVSGFEIIGAVIDRWLAQRPYNGPAWLQEASMRAARRQADL